MKYAGFLKQSLLDYPGEIATVLFTRGCNLRCPFCHNPDLLIKPKNPLPPPIDLEEVLDFLQERKGFLDAVVITGGEPTLHEELRDDIRRIKEMGYLLKLDSNGSNPMMLERLLNEKLLDYVAMDIKASIDYKKYQQACGKLSTEDFFNVRSSIQLLSRADIPVEFRTTVVPTLHTPEDIVEIATYIEGSSLYTLQQFNPRVTLDPGYSNVVPYTREQMNAIAERCQPYVKKVHVVNI
ncbi:MAG: anaerobic ribonucleoside-triphosphate reductase activating protein [Bacillota bacterium]|nr:anaerobic ribonucleoside-triphosphate reductase activating protein [Bacillota bacterium]